LVKQGSRANGQVVVQLHIVQRRSSNALLKRSTNKDSPN
jgi:hypothetical protein